MARRPLSLAQAALTALVACAATSYALAYGAPYVLGLLPMYGAAAVWKADRLASRLFLWGGGVLIAAVALIPALLMTQALGEGVAGRFAMIAGGGLAALSAIHLFGAPARAVPTSMALLVTAAFSYRLSILPALFAAAAAALVTWLAAERKPRLLPLLGLLSTAAAVAAGVSLLLPAAQPWVEARMSDLSGANKTARAGLSTTSRLGDVESLGLSSRVALRVWADAPRYLRARVYTRYAGRAWTGATPRKRMGPGTGLDDVPGSTYGSGTGTYRARILQEVTVRDALPAPSDVRLARLGTEPPWIDEAGVLTPIGPPPALYAVACGENGAGGAPEDCLEVPAGLDPRLRELAAGFKGNPEERIRLTLEELERRCAYALDVGAFRSDDPVGEFVFDKRRGYCEYFASAAALLLRMQRVPARYVVGYSVRPSNFEGGHYVVREGDAHAWVEAWLPGRGWVELDPTPASQFEAMRAPIRGSGFWERIKAWFSETFALFQQGARVAVLLRLGSVVGATVLLGIAVRWLRRRKRPSKAAVAERPPLPPGPRELLKALDVAWTRAGHPRPASRAPLEHLAKMPAPLGEAAVRAVYRCVYGGETLSDAELAALRTSVDGGSGPAPRPR